MIHVNSINIVLILIGAVMVYGAGIILGVFKQDDNMKKVLTLKLVGLGIALIGILRIFNVF